MAQGVNSSKALGFVFLPSSLNNFTLLDNKGETFTGKLGLAASCQS